MPPTTELEWKPCPVEGCERKHRRSHAMCVVHWKRVPEPLQRQLYAAHRAWRLSDADGTFAAYLEVLEACLAEASR